MKTTTLDFTQMESLIEEIEGVAWSGWFCEIFAEINSEDEIELSIGSPISNGYTQSDNVVGKLDCWFRKFKEGDAKAWAEECGMNTDPEDFDSDNCMEYEANQIYNVMLEQENTDDRDLDSIDDEKEAGTFIDNIALFAKSKGYNRLEVVNY